MEEGGGDGVEEEGGVEGEGAGERRVKMTMTMHLLSGIAAHGIYYYIQYIHIESNTTINRCRGLM